MQAPEQLAYNKHKAWIVRVCAKRMKAPLMNTSPECDRKDVSEPFILHKLGFIGEKETPIWDLDVLLKRGAPYCSTKCFRIAVQLDDSPSYHTRRHQNQLLCNINESRLRRPIVLRRTRQAHCGSV